MWSIGIDDITHCETNWFNVVYRLDTSRRGTFNLRQKAEVSTAGSICERIKLNINRKNCCKRVKIDWSIVADRFTEYYGPRLGRPRASTAYTHAVKFCHVDRDSVIIIGYSLHRLQQRFIKSRRITPEVDIRCHGDQPKRARLNEDTSTLMLAEMMGQKRVHLKIERVSAPPIRYRWRRQIEECFFESFWYYLIKFFMKCILRLK